ncbi:R-spondin-3-like [Solea solea]|uniref:R-spondin-3-like n=1 Tax=Solea solea TaxID=90069 RepID=UPI00272AE721|nr:R-spondin-3-like [Solea solea]
MWTSLFIWIPHFIILTIRVDGTKVLQQRRSSSVTRPCPAGCALCSALNGCLSCKPRLFFHLELDGMRQRGTCLSTCPRGHYGSRSPRINTCNRCKEDCAFCFSKHFCTRCRPGHFLFQGKCENSCPKGLTANSVLQECTECPIGCEVCVRRNMCARCQAHLYALHGRCHLTCPTGTEPDVQLMQCIPQVNCEVGEWTEWGPCVRKTGLQAYKKGEETRSRQVPQAPTVYGNVTEIRRRVIKKRHSPIETHF